MMLAIIKHKNGRFFEFSSNKKMNLKGEMSMLNVLHLEHTDIDVITNELAKKRDEMPQFFSQSPIVVDCTLLGEDVANFDFITLKSALLNLGFIPVGVRNHPATLNATLANAGWAVMRESLKSSVKESSPTQTEEGNTEAEVSQEQPSEDIQEVAVAPMPVKFNSLTVDKPVRSGQQIYAADSDMTVLAQTSAGSEIMADGSIHVYGPLRGRVLAGAMGNESARIFCQSLQAELIAIAGRYQLLDESDTDLIGKPAMIKLSGEKLVIESLAV